MCVIRLWCSLLFSSLVTVYSYSPLILNMVPVICRDPFYYSVYSQQFKSCQCKWADVHSDWITTLCIFDRHNTGFRRRGMCKSMKCDIEKASERWCDLAGSLTVGRMLRWCITLLFFSYSSISVLPPAFVRPCRVQITRLPDSFCNEYVQRIPFLWNMMDEDCRKSFTFTANAFPLTHSQHTVCLCFAF